jgi:branched-chain amino acid transport system substrate-binding protein
MSRARWSLVLILVITAVLAACQPAATPTPTARPQATTAPTEAATEEASVATEEATEEMMATEEATEAMMATEEATEAMMATEEATEAMMATEEATVEATAEVGDVVEVAEQAGDFATLLAAVDAAGLTETLQGEGPFTVFAPTDAAFAALLEENSMDAAAMLAREDLADILLYHVVAGNVTSEDLEEYRSTDNPDEIIVPTLLEGEDLVITFGDDGEVMINGTATVTLANVEASNGVIHVIDAVLMPPAEAEATMEATEAVAAEATDEGVEVAMASTEEATEVASEPEATVAPEAEATTETPAEVAGGSAVTVAADGNVVIGLAVGLSGEGIAPLGIDIQRGAELALADRATVTVGGQEFTVSLDVQDDLCSADGGQAVANRFAADSSVVGVVGPMCSSACRAAAPIFDAAGYTSVSPSCTAPDLVTSGYASFNRSVVSDAFQGAIAANYIYNVLGVRSIATVHDGSPYGEGLVTVVTENFEALGGEVVSSDAVAVGDTDFRGLLDDIAQNDPELIYFGGFPAEAARLIQQRADAGLEDVIFFGADGINGTEVINLSGDSAEGVFSTKAIPASSEALTSFLARYVETYGEEPPAPYNATGYDAVNILLDAVEATGTVEDGSLVVSREAVSEYVRTLSGFQGLTGVLNAAGDGDTSVSDIGVFQVLNGEFVQVYTGNVVDDEVVLTEFTAEAAPAEEATMEASEETMATEEAPMEEMTPEATEAS